MSWLASASGVVRHIFRIREPLEGLPQPKTDLMIVRRGLSSAFYFFCEVFAKENGLKVVPDRRVHDRRHGERSTLTFDRRHVDRRGEPVRWRKEDFIVVRDPRRN
jgi:hypothetical protein